ncbi:uncharacterized protein FOMMEDRAFT_156827 [Fomitiporia mediterranea MF3/22]|uniref:uncharacterized protein n=1 Tax=Fomitiporia mediterranea (strain MF3/22) TaxID=694068 RepID=UPI0004407EAB|nr:uncharacterized protein FOMMEDRAFT_156827 [Fomitiporia mediterranea MF3/22]EJD03421.1 hypothetical protein FOMMEDRAFT_156827 [Fomitiporia mediterranea MF3/22]
MLFSFTRFFTFSLLAAGALAETHKVTFENKCGKGTPQLQQKNKTVSSTSTYTANSTFESATAFLQTGECGGNGQNCTLIETNLKNSGNSSTNITLVPPQKFNVPAAFRYEGGCNGTGLNCTSANCTEAIHNRTVSVKPSSCNASNVNLIITFC